MALRLFDNEHYLKLESVNEGQMLDHIPAHVYRIAMTPDGPILTKDRKRFEISERRYGDFTKRYNLIVNRYDPTMPALGVILIGLKGSGKSMLAEAVCNWALSRDMPILIIDKPWAASLILTFVKLMGPCVVYFDEFGKVYSLDSDTTPDQKDMLTYFSDTSTQGVINLVTANHNGELLDFYFNRPQRFRFLMNYNDLTIADVDEVANEHHLKDWQRLQMHRMAAHAGLSWDMAKDIALTLRECTSPEDARDQLTFLNVPEWVTLTTSISKVMRHGEEIIAECIQARFMDERYLQVRILDEDTGKLLESFTVDFNDQEVMGESHDVGDAAAATRQWADMEYHGTRPTKSRQAVQNSAAGKANYSFVRPADHLHLAVSTFLASSMDDPTYVVIHASNRRYRDEMREAAKAKQKSKEVAEDSPLSPSSKGSEVSSPTSPTTIQPQPCWENGSNSSTLVVESGTDALKAVSLDSVIADANALQAYAAIVDEAKHRASHK